MIRLIAIIFIFKQVPVFGHLFFLYLSRNTYYYFFIYFHKLILLF